VKSAIFFVGYLTSLSVSWMFRVTGMVIRKDLEVSDMA
jgi:hypothetical protein